MNLRSRSILVVALLAVAATLAAGWQARHAAGRHGPGAGLAGSAQPVQAGGAAALPSPQPAVPVVLAVAQSRRVPLRLKAVGRIEPFSSVTLRARMDGQVASVNWQAGQHVARGQVMATMDARVPRAQLAQAQANLARDQAQLDKARSDLARYGGLVQQGFVSAAQLEVYRAALATLEATVAADAAAIDLARTQLDYTTLRAPIDGVAGAVLAYPGNVVKANDTVLAVINQVRPVYATFGLPEQELADIHDARAAGRRLPVRVAVPGSAEAHDGELVFVDNAIDAATGTIQLKARFANARERLTPGQFVEVALTVRELPEAVLIPPEALQTGPQGGFVYVARPDRTVELRPVRTLSGGEPQLVVTQGLAAGEQVVTDGQLRLVPGARYEPRADANAARP